MVLSLCFMFVGAIGIIISTERFFGGTDKQWYFHNVAGVILLITMILQVTGGVVMYFCNKRLKALHKIHAIIGHFEYLFGSNSISLNIQKNSNATQLLI